MCHLMHSISPTETKGGGLGRKKESTESEYSIWLQKMRGSALSPPASKTHLPGLAAGPRAW